MKVVTFRICGELFGINISSVREINRNVSFTAVPRSPHGFIGLYNMRGRVVSVLNIAEMLGYDYLPEVPMTCVIMKNLRGGSEMFAFSVDSVEDVLFFEDSEMRETPPNLHKDVAEQILGVYKLENDLLIVIDEQKVFFENFLKGCR